MKYQSQHKTWLEPKGHSLDTIRASFAGHPNETRNLQFCNCPAKSSSVKERLRIFIYISDGSVIVMKK